MRLAIAIGGVAGALARHAVGSVAAVGTGLSFPWGTLAVNVTGACALGFLMRLLPETTVSPATRAALTVGFCGGFTTFSTFAVEVVTLGRLRLPLAGAYVLASAVLSVLAIVAGTEASGAWVRRRARLPRTPLAPDGVPCLTRETAAGPRSSGDRAQEGEREA